MNWWSVHRFVAIFGDYLSSRVQTDVRLLPPWREGVFQDPSFVQSFKDLFSNGIHPAMSWMSELSQDPSRAPGFDVLSVTLVTVWQLPSRQDAEKAVAAQASAAVKAAQQVAVVGGGNSDPVAFAIGAHMGIRCKLTVEGGPEESIAGIYLTMPAFCSG